MTDAEARFELIRCGCSPESATRAQIGGAAKMPGPETAETGGRVSSAPANDAGCDRARSVLIPPSCWTIRIPDWHPPSLNKLLGHWAERGRIKKTTTAIVTLYVMRAGIPKAEIKRRVWIHMVMAPKQRCIDRDNAPKAVLDALVHAGALKNDSPKWVATEPITFSRGERAETFITVEDCG